jgi:hypothetical protein
MTTATHTTVTLTTHHNATVSHRDLIAACCQQDQQLATAYRTVITDCVLPEIERQEQLAYAAYCGSSATVNNLVAGHGSLISGPSPDAQHLWNVWRDLASDYRNAMAGNAPSSLIRNRPWR